MRQIPNILHKLIGIVSLITLTSSCNSNLGKGVSLREGFRISWQETITNFFHHFQNGENRNKLSNIYIDQKRLLENYLSQHQNDNRFQKILDKGELTIGRFFPDSIKYAFMAYQENDSSLVAYALIEKAGNWDTLFKHQSRSYFSEFLSPWEIIEIKDYNGDKIPDVRIVNSYWDVHPGTTGYLWTYKNGHLEMMRGFEHIISPVYDPETHLIYSYQSDGCGDMVMMFWVYEIKNQSVKSKEFVDCDCCIEGNDSCVIKQNGTVKRLPVEEAHLYVPKYFEAMVKDKCKK